ncbi:hypothetical protein PIB30_013108 [Stylosanthes scabra]|uniref:Uncharacterized protein n=1 Tax=Stylosanthes scabra TaxID=79078 RepID=A0ABU6V849_9FABA|nr:hypothetical protein [Stylosanthes scabra]
MKSNLHCYRFELHSNIHLTPLPPAPAPASSTCCHRLSLPRACRLSLPRARRLCLLRAVSRCRSLGPNVVPAACPCLCLRVLRFCVIPAALAPPCFACGSVVSTALLPTRRACGSRLSLPRFRSSSTSNTRTHSAAPCLPILSPFPPRRRRPPRFSALLLPPSVQNSLVFFLLRPVIHRRRTFALSQQRRPSEPHPCRRSRTRASAVAHSHPSPFHLVAVPARPAVPASSNSQPATPSIKSATASTRPAS